MADQSTWQFDVCDFYYRLIEQQTDGSLFIQRVITREAHLTIKKILRRDVTFAQHVYWIYMTKESPTYPLLKCRAAAPATGPFMRV